MRFLAYVMIFTGVKKGQLCKSSGMNAMFDIHYNFRFSVKLSTRMINSTREK